MPGRDISPFSGLSDLCRRRDFLRAGDFQGLLAAELTAYKGDSGCGNSKFFSDIFKQVFIGFAVDRWRAYLHFEALSIEAYEGVAAGFWLHVAVQQQSVWVFPEEVGQVARPVNLDTGYQSGGELCRFGEVANDNSQYIDQQKHEDG